MKIYMTAQKNTMATLLWLLCYVKHFLFIFSQGELSTGFRMAC